mmetsp:Transcript_32082/g.66970  ORF Transcript_32082/g.66970 Transcript_32082/m.66970 type:complete len:271 (-) Transcript_32082:345-1157(-)|eukprot:CAMPEP_0172459724 /NCGR_PEP_ID=MMETSP1065-20121228/33840_1 /TAXON_ID=265537 /ORGANISM="Amphiprora paludosa, Strain CCMP125" /LENGTH=270 /DNA_ID=CAMNT_0013214507 /DNA_START=199 /DNA_END=1011 /DNA_ORIENTATION=-
MNPFPKSRMSTSNSSQTTANSSTATTSSIRSVLKLQQQQQLSQDNIAGSKMKSRTASNDSISDLMPVPSLIPPSHQMAKPTKSALKQSPQHQHADKKSPSSSSSSRGPNSMLQTTFTARSPHIPIEDQSPHKQSVKHSSSSLPCPHTLKRTASQVRLEEEEELADFRDYVFFSRLVQGIATSTTVQSERALRQNDVTLAHIIGTRNGSLDHVPTTTRGGGQSSSPRQQSQQQQQQHYDGYYNPQQHSYQHQPSSSSSRSPACDEMFVLDW